MAETMDLGSDADGRCAHLDASLLRSRVHYGHRLDDIRKIIALLAHDAPSAIFRRCRLHPRRTHSDPCLSNAADVRV